MEHALDPKLIAAALGDGAGLPSPDKLIEWLETAEISLVLSRPKITTELLNTGWYLHGIASSPRSLELYPAARQRQAFQVSAHIFDLALSKPDLSPIARLRLGFGSQVGYLQSDLTPNTIATYERVRLHTPCEFPSQELGLRLATALLGLDRRFLYEELDHINRQSHEFEASLGVPISETIFAALDGVLGGVYHLLNFLTYGDRGQLERARTRLHSATQAKRANADLDNRWVATHLLALTDGLDSSSIWSALPPTVPDGAKRAFTMSNPPVLLLWPPQLQVLREQSPSVLDPSTHRMFLTLPTSAGKTLLAQLLILTHLTTNETSVCFVAPTHSLCREVRRSLKRRFRMLRQTIEQSNSIWDVVSTEDSPTIEVMTPERLAFLIRRHPAETLERFGMFVVDEAHTVGDATRGWTLETVLSVLHSATLETSHRIILLSSAVGNEVHFRAWLDPSNRGLATRSQWRGPRRLTCVYTTAPDWQSVKSTAVRSQTYSHRESHPLYGIIHLRPGTNSKAMSLRTTKPVGTLCFKIEAASKARKKDAENSTAFYRQLVPLLATLARSGPVLSVCGTRLEARQLGLALAEEAPSERAPSDLIAAASERLGPSHPVTLSLIGGVAVHYAALPSDILESIEDAVRDGLLSHVVSTTTLTEGVNLPVRTVVITGTGAYTANGYQEIVTGARLINAIGRAGRAAKECEGWVVLARNAEFTEDDFHLLRTTADDITVMSELATSRAIDELTSFEVQIAEAEDAVLASARGSIAERFVSFVWFALESLAQLQGEVPEGAGIEILERTLAWRQLEPDSKVRWQALASRAERTYRATPEDQRRRWSSTGTSIASSRVLDGVVAKLCEHLETANEVLDDLDDPFKLLDILFQSGAIPALLELPEAPASKIYSQRTGANRFTVHFDLREVLGAWLGGQSLIEIANHHLADVKREDYRVEQLADFLNSTTSHFLAWTVGIVLSWTGATLDEADSQCTLCTELPAYLREGVSTPQALELLREGIRSRRLAQRVSADFLSTRTSDSDDLRSWLTRLGVVEWRLRFDANAADLADLVEFSRARVGGLLSEVLYGGTFHIPLDAQAALGTVRLAQIPNDHYPKRYAAWCGDLLLGPLPSEFQGDVIALVATGLPLELGLEAHPDQGTVLAIRLRPMNQDPRGQAEEQPRGPLIAQGPP